MTKVSLPLLLAIGLPACGVDTVGTAATVAALKAKEARQGQETGKQIVKQIDEANRATENRLKDTEEK